MAGSENIQVVYGKTLELLKVAQAALVTSGTATLETALIGTPQVVCYKTAPVSYLVARMLVRIKYISLVNLILERGCITELIQNRCSAPNIINSLNLVLNDPDFRSRITVGYRELDAKLGDREASATAAAVVCRLAMES